MVEPMGLKKYSFKVTFNGINLPTRFHENPPIGSKVIRGDTDRWSDDLTSLLSFLN
jgi:hypothetical protein